jgi:GAF domain-containing protein
MRRRSRASSKLAKARSRKATTVRGRGSSGRQETEVARLTRERDEALERETATSEVLKVISSSPGELEPVFQAMLENVTRVCGATSGLLVRAENDGFRIAASWRQRANIEDMKHRTFKFGPSTPIGRAVRTRQIVHVPNLSEDPAYLEREPLAVWAVEQAKVRTVLVVPMLKRQELVGVFGIERDEVRPFTDTQIALVQNFAAQAVIAIENARLLNELRQRTADLSESLEQQTATSEVLKVISSSPGELQPVFNAMLDNATRLCEARYGTMWLREGDAFRAASLHGPLPPAFTDLLRSGTLFRASSDTPTGRVAQTRQPVQVFDLREIHARDPITVAAVEVAGIRTMFAVPMLKEDQLVGTISIYRQEILPFTNKQIELVQNFATQAVIAIENARLLNELRESLQQQTATADVLKVISRSTFDLQTVLDTLLASAARLCEADKGGIMQREGDVLRIASNYGFSREAVQYALEHPLRPDRGSATGRAAVEGKPIHIPDVLADQDYQAIGYLQAFGYRTILAVPLLREGTTIGTFTLTCDEVNPFTEKQIELVTTFADQAVIAIENARLLNELRQRTEELSESLEQRTATSEVLSVISRSPANIQPVFEVIGERARKLCDAEISLVSIVEGELICLASIHGPLKVGEEAARRAFPMRLTDETVAARAIRTRSVCNVPDVLSDPQYQLKGVARVSGYRAALGVPMVRDEQVIGAIFVARKQPGLFSDAQVQLLKTFADQAVIAIENVRLFNETKSSLAQQTATADVLKVISRSAFDLRAVLQTLVESAARFCDADKAHIVREKDGAFYIAEAFGYSREFMDYIKNLPIKAERGTASGRALLESQVVHIADVKADPEYTQVEGQRLGDYRTILCVPMLREGLAIGVLVLTRSEVRPFAETQIELVSTFADQAAIAIENVRLFDEIQDKSRQLEEASQHKSQFLANMSHELRTPLNAILGYTELMADGAYGEPSEKMLGILKRLEANGKHLLGLINDVLDLSKIEAGQLVLELSDYCIQDIAQTVRSTLEPLAADKKLGFKVEIAPQLPSGHGDGRRLTQVLINLVGNAIKFTDAGEVAIKAEANNGAFYVSVRDTGPGISSADQARLFQEFQQADNAITKKKGGTGLGLAISKRIIEMHGGRIWVESQPGQGSTFTFTLPVIVERQVEPA